MLKHPKEAFHSNFVSLDCDQGSMVTQHGKPMFTQVSNPAGCGALRHLNLIPFLVPKMFSAVPQGGIMGSGQMRREGGHAAAFSRHLLSLCMTVFCLPSSRL